MQQLFVQYTLYNPEIIQVMTFCKRFTSLVWGFGTDSKIKLRKLRIQKDMLETPWPE